MTKKMFSARDLVLSGLFCGLMIVGANLRIPFPLVPLTFQPFFAILSGLLLGPVLGALSLIIYLLLGLAGLPVFAGASAGPLYVLQPTFGFLLGFMLAALAAGKLTWRKAKLSLADILLASLVGLLIIYVAGILYMFLIQTLYLANEVTVLGLTMAMVPFFIKDLVLFAGASVLASRLIPLVRKTK